MLYRELGVEHYWDMPKTKANKKEKINSAIMTGMYGATIKKDGEHIRAIYDTDGEIWILGRGTNAKAVHNLDKHLVFITEWLRANFTPGTCILGEIHVPGKTARSIRAYTGSLVPKSLANQKVCPPRFYIFDVWGLNGRSLMDCRYEDRMWILGCTEFQKCPHPQIDYVKMVRGTQEILDFIAEAFENGEEGCVLTLLDSKPEPWLPTAKSWKTIKVKKEFQSNIDCFFTGNYREPTREYTGKEIETWKYWENVKESDDIYSHIELGELYKEYLNGRAIEPVTKPYALGLPGSLEVGVYKGTQIVPICYLSGLSDELKEQFATCREEVVMRPIAITGMEATDQSIRHPKFVHFRDDIPLRDCTWEKIFGD